MLDELYIDAAVREDVIDRLTAKCPTAEGHVFAKHPGDLQPHEIPAILVFPHDTIVEIHGVAASGRIEVQPAQIKTLIYAEGDDADEVAEQIAIEVRRAMLNDQPPATLGSMPTPVFPRSKPMDVRCLRSSRVPDPNSPLPVHQRGVIVLTYEFKVATPEGRPTEALQLG